jgi:hypothetical protein
MAPATVTVEVNGSKAAEVVVARTLPAAFSQ